MSVALAPSPTRAPSARAGGLVPSLLVAIVVVGAGWRIWGLGANRLNYDEAFTAMAGRHSLGSLFDYLRNNDSHPPLDYLLHAPLARLGVSELLFRLPSALFSIAALALFAYWMRTLGRAGVLATAIMAVSAFQLVHGREARMYAELELLGVAVAMLADAWLRSPRRRHAPILATLVLAGLLTHVSMFLLGAGLFLLAGRRTDGDAWRWRGAIAGAGLAWAMLWGPSFLVQSRGGHSDWIPRTTLPGIVDTVARLVSNEIAYALVVFVAVALGGVALWQRERRLGVVWICCFAVPLGLAAAAGVVAPVLLDRTLTLTAWAPLLAIAVLLDTLLTRSRVLGIVGVILLTALTVPAAMRVVTGRSGPDEALRRIEARSRPGDVIAVRSAGKSPEIGWSVGVRGDREWRRVRVTGVSNVAGLALGRGPLSGRVWIVDWNSRLRVADGYQRCAPDWNFGVSRVLCLQRDSSPSSAGEESSAPESHDVLALARHWSR